MQRLSVGNTVLIKAILTSTNGEAVAPEHIKMVINTPSGTEVELNENISHLIYLESIATNVVGYNFTPTEIGVYKFSFKLTSGGKSITCYLNVVVA